MKRMSGSKVMTVWKLVIRHNKGWGGPRLVSKRCGKKGMYSRVPTNRGVWNNRGEGVKISPKTNNRGGWSNWGGGKKWHNFFFGTNVIKKSYNTNKVHNKSKCKTKWKKSRSNFFRFWFVSLMKCVQICTRFRVGFELQWTEMTFHVRQKLSLLRQEIYHLF